MFSFIINGCSSNNQQQGQEQQSSQENKKDSDKLKKIETNVESMIAMLSGIPNKPEEEQEEEQEGGQQQGSQQQSQQTGQQGNQQSNQQATQQPKGLLQPKPEVNWEEALKSVEKTHTQWNDYAAQAAKDGISKNNIDAFSTALNELTNHIGAKDRAQSMLASNILYLHLTNFWTLYDSKIPPDLKKLKYYIRNVMYYSDMSEWPKAESNFNLCGNLFESIRATTVKDQQEAINKVDFSIQELKRVVMHKNAPLIKLKGKLALDNILSLEKELESGNQG